MKALELINIGYQKLKLKKITSFRLDSEVLLSKVLKKTRENILINLNQKVASDKIVKFNEFINRRALNEPVAYITNQKEFWSKNFYVNSKTLIPRPETELIVDKLIRLYDKKSINILDIGTGSGCILISLLSELKNSKGTGIDISNGAIKVAKKNAKNLKVSSRSKFYFNSLERFFPYKYDLVVSNPPYIKSKEIKKLQNDIWQYEPKIALDGGNDGLDLIKKVIYKSKKILKIKGRLALEIGQEQLIKVSEILKNNNFRIEHYINDYKQNTRSIISVLKQ